MLKNYIKIAYRSLLKYKGYSVINVLGLAVGVAVSLLIALFVSHEVSYDTYHDRADQIYRVATQTPQRRMALTSSVVSPVMQKNFPEVQKGVRILKLGSDLLRYGENVFIEAGGAFADSSFFDVFSFEVLSGNPKTALIRPHTMVISHVMAEKYFGNENPVGKTLLLNNETEYEVTGVMKQMPSNSHFHFDFVASLISLEGWRQLTDQEMEGQQFYTYVVLKEGASPEELAKKVNAFISQNFAGDDTFSLSLQPLTDIHLYSDLFYEIQPQGDIFYVMAASATALLILIIACINYMNLTTARSVRRSREVGVRKVLGSDRKHLIGQFYGESAILVGLALILAIFLVEIFLTSFNQLAGLSLVIDYSDPIFWLALGLTGTVVTVLAGSYPAIVLSKLKPVSALKGTGSGNSGGNAFLRKALVVFQFAVSVFLIIGTLVIYRQVEFIQEKELGYKKEKVFVLNLYNGMVGRFEAFRSEVLQVSGIDNVTMASETPVDIGAGHGLNVEGVSMDSNMVVKGLAVHPEFNRTLHINMVAGRDLRQADYRAANPGSGKAEFAFLLNQTAVRALGLKPDEVIGRKATSSPRAGTVIGVVEDFHLTSFHEEIEPLMMFPENNFSKLMIGFGSNNLRQTIDQTQRVWEKVYPDYPFDFTFLDQEYDALYRQETQAGNLLAGFAVLAIFIACLGLFGLVSFMSEQRRKEIGIRKVMGATIANIVSLFSMDFMKLVLLGIAFAVPAAWLVMNQWLQDFAYRIEIGLGIFTLAGGAAFLIALATVSWQSIKAALTNPVSSLRSE